MHLSVFFTLVEVVIKTIDLGAHTSGHFTGNAQEGSMMKAIVPEKHPQGKDLQHYKGYKRDVPPYKQENIAHGTMVTAG